MAAILICTSTVRKLIVPVIVVTVRETLALLPMLSAMQQQLLSRMQDCGRSDKYYNGIALIMSETIITEQNVY